jgi:hypothetical protein
VSLSIQNALRRPSRRLRPYKIQRWDSAAVSLKAQRRQYRSIQRNSDKVILCWVIRSQPDGTQIRPRSRRRAGTRHQRTSVATRVPGGCQLLSYMIAILAAAWPGTRQWTYGNDHGGAEAAPARFHRTALKRISAMAIKKPQLRSNMSASINYLYKKPRVRREVP